MQTALITGASGGIGYELAKLCAKDGNRVVLVARSAEQLANVAAELSSLGAAETLVLAKDLSAPHAAREVHQELTARAIAVDVLINNAGYGLAGKFVDLDSAAQLNMIALNITALTELTHHFLGAMIARGTGRVLNISSTAAFQPGPLMAVYYATKAYVLSFSEALSEELRGTGVTATCLCPGATRTGFGERANMGASRLFKAPTVMDADDVARIGYAAMKKGKPLVIAGPYNAALAFSVRFTPRWLIPKITRALHERV